MTGHYVSPFINHFPEDGSSWGWIFLRKLRCMSEFIPSRSEMTCTKTWIDQGWSKQKKLSVLFNQIHTHTHISMCIYIYIYIYIYIDIYMHVYICLYVHVYQYACIYQCVCVYLYTYIWHNLPPTRIKYSSMKMQSYLWHQLTTFFFRKMLTMSPLCDKWILVSIQRPFFEMN